MPRSLVRSPAIIIPNPPPPFTPEQLADAAQSPSERLRSACTISTPTGDVFPPQATPILPRLYLSDLYTATSSSALSSLGITHIISVIDTPREPPIPVRRLEVPIKDRPDANLLSHLAGAVTFIEEALEEDPRHVILVHCRWGRSRSASVIAAYLLSKGLVKTPREAIEFIQSKREIVKPNEGFMKQLETYAERRRRGSALCVA